MLFIFKVSKKYPIYWSNWGSFYQSGNTKTGFIPKTLIILLLLVWSLQR